MLTSTDITLYPGVYHLHPIFQMDETTFYYRMDTVRLCIKQSRYMKKSDYFMNQTRELLSPVHFCLEIA